MNSVIKEVDHHTVSYRAKIEDRPNKLVLFKPDPESMCLKG